MNTSLRRLAVVVVLLLSTSVPPSTQHDVPQRRAVAMDAESAVAAKEHSLIDSKQCDGLRPLCSATHLKATDNVSVLECVNALQRQQRQSLPDKCQHLLWQHQRYMLTGKWLSGELAARYCGERRQQQDAVLSCANSVDMWQCLRERADQMEHGSQCRSFLRRTYETLFRDYDELGDFFAACGPHIDQLECGRLAVERGHASQLETVQCLRDSGAEVLAGGPCEAEMGRIEQQRDDLEFFDICNGDLQRLCSQEQPGTMEAFKCLVRNKNNAGMSRRCGEQIAQRDHAIATDYRQSHGLAKACKEDIKLHHCRRGIAEDKQVRLAQILLCLESVAKNGTKIAPECIAEITDHRHMLMQDYQLSPEILNDCVDDIPRFCGEFDVKPANGGGGGGGQQPRPEYGNLIHCLMEHSRIKRRKDRRISPQCQRSLEALIKVSDAGEDWRVDPVLRRACKPVVDVACRDTEGGGARVMTCLMENINTPVMTPDCEQALLLIQYFVARDFKLDPQLYKHCRDDAIQYCRAKRVWDDVNDAQMDPERGPLILPCLHSIAYQDDPKLTLRKDCLKEVKRVMRQRAVSVGLIPEVEDNCIEDLSKLCGSRTEHGAEMDCLQMNMEKLEENCKKAVDQYTAEEAEHVELNPVIMSVCTEAMKTHCSDILRGGKDKGDMMDCLIAHKNDADMRQDLKCRAAIEHFQIISLKSYHFTYKFKEACRRHVVRYCASSTTKNEVVACLSEVMRDDTIKGKPHSLPKECRQQVKAQLYQQRESLLLDPKLAHACQKEMDDLCSSQRGPGEAIECLVANTHRLGNECHHAIFMVKKSELGDSGTDFTLVNTCKEMTYKFCPKVDSLHLLDCLKTYRDDSSFDPRCHLVVVNRMIEQNTDFRFNPKLQLACGNNIDKYCSDIVATAQPNEELNGKVIQCLKVKFRESRLDERCSQEMIQILQEQALNYKLNPLLQNFCKSEIEVLCKPYIRSTEEHGLVEECLKTAFVNQKILNRNCRIEVATLIAEAKADIHVDPILENACSVDLLRYCSNVQSGNGRKLKCLQVVLQDQSKAMDDDCSLMLKRRMEMFHNADTVLAEPPQNMEQLYTQVVTSPAKRFFLVVLMTVVGMIFLMGIFLGRATKRAMSTKNK